MNYNLTEESAIYSPSQTIIIIIKQMNGQYSIFSPADPRARLFRAVHALAVQGEGAGPRFVRI